MKKLLLATSLLLMVFYGYSRSFTLNHGEPTTKTYRTTVSYNADHYFPIVEVELGGKTRRFLFDTGAPCTISHELYIELGLQPVHTLPIRDQGMRSDTLRVVELPHLQLGSLTFANAYALVSSAESPLFSCFDVDGIVGTNILRSSVVRISSVDSTITIASSPRDFDLRKEYAVKMRLTPIQSAPYVFLELKGEGGHGGRLEALFDTGYANGLLDVQLSAYHRFSDEEKNPFRLIAQAKGGSNSIGMFGVGSDTTAYLLGLAQLRLGGVTLTSILAHTVQGGSKLGSRLLDFGIVTLDFKGKRFYFEPFSPIVDADCRQLGYSPTYANGKPLVATVWDAALADKLAVGDELLTINGLSLEGMTFCEFVLTKRLTDVDELRLTIRRANGELSDLTINRKTYAQLVGE